jgi:hypothetical protein
MSTWSRHPVIDEINTWVRLSSIASVAGTKLKWLGRPILRLITYGLSCTGNISCLGARRAHVTILRDGRELDQHGLYVDLEAWKGHLFGCAREAASAEAATEFMSLA